jgi:hypothetical protein
MHHDGDPKRPIPLTAVEARVCARIWQKALGADAVATDGRYPWSPQEDVDVAQAACHGGVDDRDQTRTPQVALLLAGETVVSQAALQNGPMAREWLNTACVAGRGFDDLFTGDPTGLPSGALRRGSTAMAAFLPPVPDRIGLLVGILSCLGMAEEQLTLEAATHLAKRIIAGRRDGEQEQRLIFRLTAELAEELADRVHAHWVKYHAWVESEPDVEDSFDDFCRTFDESQLGPYLPLLGRTALPVIQDAAPTDRDETRSLLADHLDPLPDPNNPEDQADIGVALYGLTVFGDPGALRYQAP